MMGSSPGLFDSCRISFVESKLLAKPIIDELSDLVTKYGGTVVEPDRHGKLRLNNVTHVVSSTIDFEQYTEALSKMVPVVKNDWITQSLHRGKQAQLRPYSPDPRLIFHNVVVTCADIPQLDKESIAGAVMALGGMEGKDVTRLTTHICALTLDHPKCQEAEKKAPNCKIVLPHWFDDCFRLGKRISEEPYMLPSPEILEKVAEDELQVPQNENLKGATSATPNTILQNHGIASARETLEVFSQKKIFLSTDLPITDRLRSILTELIESGGGHVVNDEMDCDWFVCHWRDGEQYVRAAQAGKEVGNLSWLYHLIVNNEWTSPLRRLLHYPMPKKGIPGFEDMKIALSNYGGEARIYLENLITALGASYTKTMKADNTHLITARQFGEKCDAAVEWNIDVLNHLWVEESYAHCEMQSLANPKYSHFPPRTNLGEVIGQTFLNESKLREKYYPGGEEKPAVAGRPKRRINEMVQDVIFPVGQEDDHAPVVSKAGKPLRGANKGTTKKAQNGDKTEEKARAFATPAKKQRAAGKENDTPSIMSTGSRSAKTQALHKLQDLAPDVALYEKEKKRSTKDGHPWGGKRAADQIDKDRAAKSSSPAQAGEDEGEEAEEDSRRRAKRQKSLPTVDMRICLTGYQRWVQDKHKEEYERRKLRDMGIQVVTNDSTAVEFLGAPRMVRTMKFLRALARGPTVLDSKFIDVCLDTGKVPNIDDYQLQDRENEKKFGVTLDQAIARAKKNKGKLLWGIPIYCTADISNGYQSYQSIAEANGAIFKVYSARSGTTIKPTSEEEDGGAAPEPVYLLTSNSAAEKKLWEKFAKMAKKGNMEPRIVVSDWLLDVAMRQELIWDETYLVGEYFNAHGKS